MAPATHRKSWLPRWLARWLAVPPAPTSELQRARRLIAAIDAGGIPLNPARVNRIARDLGLEVSRNAPVEQTIERIRAAVARGERGASATDA